MPGFSGQGKVWIGPRDAGGNPGALVWMGNALSMVVALSEDTIERNESFSGQRLPLRRATRAKQATVRLSGDEWNAANLTRWLQGTQTLVAAGSPVANEVAPANLAVGHLVVLGGQNVSAVTVVDSTGAPKTLTAGVNYRLNAELGSWELLDLATGGPFVQPFKTNYTPGQRTVVALFNAGNPELWVRFEGINTDDDSQVLVDLYRARFSPASEVPLIQDEFATFEQEGSVLVDSTKLAGGTLGQFGRIVLLAT